jgi:agmatinase
MTKISETKIAKYQKLGLRSALKLKNKQLGDFFQRAEAEGCRMFQFPFNLQGKEWGFFRAPYSKELEGVDIACIGIPLDSSAPNFAGTRHGPEAVRRWSHLQGPMHHLTKLIPFENCNIVEYGDVDFTGLNHADRINDIYQTYMKIKDAGVIPLSVGGEHTMSYPILKAIARDEPVGLIHIDAHGDTTGFLSDDDPSEVHDGNCFSRAAIDGLIDPERTIQVGIRGSSSWCWEFSEDSGMRVVYAEEIQERGVKAIVQEARELIGDGPCYLTIDVDALDPAYMPGTGVPEPFGLTPLEVRDFIRGLRGLDLHGADIAEICPARDSQEISATLGAALAFEMLCLLTEAQLTRTGNVRRTHWHKNDLS